MFGDAPVHSSFHGFFPSAHLDLAHGQAVALVLPSVIRHNAADHDTAARYAALAIAGDLCDTDTSDAQASEQLALRVEQLTAAAGLRVSMEARGVTDDVIGGLAAEAAAQWTARFNPTAVQKQDFEALFRAAR